MTDTTERHWAQEKERGSFVLMKGTALALRYLGRKPMAPLIYVIVVYFFVFGRRARRNVREYQHYLSNWSNGTTPPPDTRRVFAQFMAFATSLLDRLDVWRGKLKLADIVIDDPHGVRNKLIASQHSGRGQILVGAHLGSLDICRALAELGEQVPINVLVHTRHTAMFNQLQQEAGDGHMRLLQVSELDAAVMMQLSQRLDRGEWLAIAGDRVPIHGGRSVSVDFLGQRAAFPQGPWLLAGLLRCPVNLLCCMKIDGRYRVILEPFLENATWERGRRDEAIEGWVARYATWLGKTCLLAPQQWFNFFPFWQTPYEEPIMRSKGELFVSMDVIVPFFDVDSMEVVWHGHYVKYLEVVRCALLEHIGHDYRQMKNAGYAWPIVDMQLRYVGAARFGQRIALRADLIEWENRLKMHYEITDADTGKVLTRASTVQVAVQLASGELQLVSPACFTDAVELARR